MAGMKGKEKTARERVRRCWVCSNPYVTTKRTSDCCAKRDCRMIQAEFRDFITLTSIIQNARWAGAPSQEEMAREYFRQKMRDAVEQLGSSEDALSKVLIELAEEAEMAAA
jgi:hypothetical protein